MNRNEENKPVLNNAIKQVFFIAEERQLRQIIREEMQAATRKEPEPDFSERMTRRQASKFMQVSYQTMYNYTRDGLIKEHGTTGKKFYLRSELIQVMKNADSKK